MSKRRCIISIDTEAQPGRTDSKHVDKLIWGRFGSGDHGIGRMMDVADAHGVRLSYFLDYAEFDLYGDALLDVGREIYQRSHDLQLHIHPEFICREFFSKRGFSRNIDFFSMEKNLVSSVFERMINLHSKVSSSPLSAFRGGGFRYGSKVLEVLSDFGIGISSNYNPAKKNQPVNFGASSQYQWSGLGLEVPVSCVKNFLGLDRVFNYNFNASALSSDKYSEDVCIERHKKFLDSFYCNHGESAIAVMVMHSWSFLKMNENGFYEYENDQASSRFERLLNELKSDVEFVTFSDVDVNAELFRGVNNYNFDALSSR